MSKHLPKRERRRLRKNWPPVSLAQYGPYIDFAIRQGHIPFEIGLDLHGLRRTRRENWRKDRTRETETNLGKKTVTEQQKKELLDRHEKLIDKSRFNAFVQETRRLHSRLPKALVSPIAKSIARNKLKRITSATILVQRFENLPKVLSQLESKNILENEEAMIVDRSPSADQKRTRQARKQNTILRPGLEMEMHIGRAGALANVSLASVMESLGHECRVIFDEKSFANTRQFGEPSWGHSRAPAHILGIQIYDPKPEALLQFAKAMAKRRLNDPMVIFDVYGKVFYP